MNAVGTGGRGRFACFGVVKILRFGLKPDKPEWMQG
jgi:hypothetical protein